MWCLVAVIWSPATTDAPVRRPGELPASSADRAYFWMKRARPRRGRRPFLCGIRPPLRAAPAGRRLRAESIAARPAEQLVEHAVPCTHRVGRIGRLGRIDRGAY